MSKSAITKMQGIIVAIIIIIALVIGVYFAILPSPSPSLGRPIKIAVCGPMAFKQGQDFWQGATLAAEEINEKYGGIKVGSEIRPIELVKIDTNDILSPTVDAPAAVERAITIEGADFIIGPFSSASVLVCQEVAMDYKKIMIADGSSEAITAKVRSNYDRYKYFFTFFLTLTQFAKSYLKLFEFVLNIVKSQYNVPNPKVAIIIEGNVWGDGIYSIAKPYISSLGCQIVYEARPSSSATDLTVEFTAIKSAGVHIIFEASTSSILGATIGRQWGELGVPAILVGCNAEAQKGKEYWDETAGYAEYELTFNQYAKGVNITHLTGPFFEKYVTKYGRDPTQSSVTYDVVYLLADAITRAGTTDADAVVVELEKIGTRQGVTQLYRSAPDGLTTVGKWLYNDAHQLTWQYDDPYVHPILGRINPKDIPGLYCFIGTQLVNGELKCVYPPDIPGTSPYEIPLRFEETFK
ncbi:MAG: ABC transporter substrate-binding protein [Candidatus Bathyarchaeia archaeon]